MDTATAIRTAVVKGGEVHNQAGAGITKQMSGIRW